MNKWPVAPGGFEMTTQVENEYDVQARKFLATHKLTLRMEQNCKKKGDICPPWEEGQCVHGDRYRVTIRRTTKTENLPRSLSFNFWNSLHDIKAELPLRPYTVLACMASDATMPTDPDELIAELGPMKVAQALACVKAAKRLQAFFSEAEIDALREIQ